jgi:hypothetical protein
LSLVRDWFQKWRFVVLAVPAVCYLLYVPTIIATTTTAHISASNGVLTCFCVFLYLQFWAIGADMAYSSAAALYGFQKKTIFPRTMRLLLASTESELRPIRIRMGPIVSTCVSYLWTVYGFAVAYTFLSHYDHDAFNVPTLGVFDALYFSVVTAATVGYGDIYPHSKTAKALVMAEILFALMYAVFFFSVLASSISSKQPTPGIRPKE